METLIPRIPAGFETRCCVNCSALPSEHEPIVFTRITHDCHMQGEPIAIVACRGCGLVFMNPRPAKASIDRLYVEDLYRAPKRRRKSSPQPGKVSIADLYRVLMTEFLRTTLRGKRVLDVGANEGQWLNLFDADNELVGIEPSAAALRPARDDIELIHSDLETVALHEQFDLVTATALIEHLCDPLEGLTRMNAFLKTGGLLFLYTPDVKGLTLRRGVAKYFKVTHLYYFSVATLSSLLHKAGFELDLYRIFAPHFGSPFVFPSRGFAGNFCVLARKIESVSIEEARRRAALTGPSEYDEVRSIIGTAMRRDRFSGNISSGIAAARGLRNKVTGTIKRYSGLAAARRG
jgi:SAM-dependent methyltransferase